jgi:hypothetical protein
MVAVLLSEHLDVMLANDCKNARDLSVQIEDTTANGMSYPVP